MSAAIPPLPLYAFMTWKGAIMPSQTNVYLVKLDQKKKTHRHDMAGHQQGIHFDFINKCLIIMHRAHESEIKW